MLDEITFDKLLNSLAISRVNLGGSRLRIAEMPDPFVQATLKARGKDPENLFSVEVIFIEAPAAVGKSTMARYLSALAALPC